LAASAIALLVGACEAEIVPSDQPFNLEGSGTIDLVVTGLGDLDIPDNLLGACQEECTPFVPLIEAWSLEGTKPRSHMPICSDTSEWVLACWSAGEKGCGVRFLAKYREDMAPSWCLDIQGEGCE